MFNSPLSLMWLHTERVTYKELVYWLIDWLIALVGNWKLSAQV